MNERKPPVRSCTSRIMRRCSMRSALVSPVPIMNVAVDSRPRPCAVSMTDSQTSPVSFSGAMAVRGRSTRISAPAPANESRPAALQPADDLGVLEPGRPPDVHDLGRAEASAASAAGSAALIARERLLVPLDAELGRVAALQHDLRGAELDGLAAAAQDLLERVRPALGVLRRAVERAELAGRHADVGVVDVAVDDVRRDRCPGTGAGARRRPPGRARAAARRCRASAPRRA